MTDWATRYSWWPDALLLKCGLITRTEATKRGVPHIHAGTPEQTELDHFETWLLWRAKGALPPRPGNLVGWLPEREYWATLHAYVVAHHVPPVSPPPPPNNPPSKWTNHPNVPWYVKRVDISHWLRTDNGVADIATLIQRLHDSGTKAVTFQFGDDCPDHDWATHGPALYKACKSDGIPCGTWGRCDYRPWEDVKRDLHAAMDAGCDGLMADVEGPVQDAELPEHLAAEFPEIPMSVIATGAIDDAWPNMTPGEIAVRFGDNFDFVGQDYYKRDASPPFPLTPAMMENFVYWRSTEKNGGKGFRHLPALGGRWHASTLMCCAEGCPPLSEQRDLAAGWAPLGHWDAEILEGNGQWSEWAKF